MNEIQEFLSKNLNMMIKFLIFYMGLLTWVIIGIVILAVIGLGPRTFLSGISQGAQKVGSNPVIRKATEEGKEYAENIIKNATNQIADKGIS
jgi:hypothetical protein